MQKNVYDVEINLDHLKGFTKEYHNAVPFKPRLPAVKRAGNLQAGVRQ